MDHASIGMEGGLSASKKKPILELVLESAEIHDEPTTGSAKVATESREGAEIARDLPSLPRYVLREWQQRPRIEVISLLKDELKTADLEAAAFMSKKLSRETKQRGEDSLVFDYNNETQELLFGAADGLGGGGAPGSGAEASCEAATHVAQVFRQLEKTRAEYEVLLKEIVVNRDQRQTEAGDAARNFEDWEDVNPNLVRLAGLLRRAIVETHKHLQTKGSDDERGKTTLSLGLITPKIGEKRYLITANAGDSGIILRKKDGRTYLVTEDDAFLVRGDKLGIVPRETLEFIRKSPKHRESVRSTMVNGLGQSDLLSDGSERRFCPDIAITELEEGDTVLAATDGLFKAFHPLNAGSDEVPADKFEAFMNGTDPASDLGRLVEFVANQTKLQGDDDKAAEMITVL